MAETATIRCTNCGKLNRVAVVASGLPRCGNCRALLPWIVDADASNFDAAIDTELPALVDFWAAWCMPCRTISPALEKLAREHAGEVKLVKVDIDANTSLAERYTIRSIPQLVLFRDGKELDRVVGALPEPRLRQWLAGHLATPPAAASAGG
jgi:thioredoxin 2